MKKRLLALLLLALGTCSLCISSITVFADTQSEVIVPAKTEIVYSSKGNFLPSILSDQYTYNVSVYNVEDTEYTNPIEENVGMVYTFAKPGTYGLKYTLTNLATNAVTYAYSVITVVDTETPKLFINGAYQDFYEVGANVSVLDVFIYDNADTNLTQYSYKVLLNGVDITARVIEGKLIIEKGSYEIIYSAEDKSGNVGTLSVYFAGGNPKTDNYDSCVASIGCAPLVGIGLAALVCLKQKGGKKDEKDE